MEGGKHACVLSCFCYVWLFVTLWTIAHQSPLSMGFSRHEYWSGLPCSPLGYQLNPGIEPASLKSPALAGEFFTTHTTWEAHLPSNLRSFSKSCLLTFGAGLALQFFYSVTRGGWFIWKQCFWEKGREMCFPLMCPKKGKWHAFIFFTQLELFIPCWLCVVKD